MGKKRRRRSFSPEFKAEAIRVVRESGKSVSTVARELDLTETALRRWVVQAEVDAGRSGSGPLTTDERVELTQLRRDVKTLRMERDILKKATVRSTGGCNTMSPASWRKGTVGHGGWAARDHGARARGHVGAMEGRRVVERDQPGAREAAGVRVGLPAIQRWHPAGRAEAQGELPDPRGPGRDIARPVGGGFDAGHRHTGEPVDLDGLPRSIAQRWRAPIPRRSGGCAGMGSGTAAQAV